MHIIRAARISGQYFELLIKNLLKIALKDHFRKFSLNHCYRLEPTGEGGSAPWTGGQCVAGLEHGAKHSYSYSNLQPILKHKWTWTLLVSMGSLKNLECLESLHAHKTGIYTFAFQTSIPTPLIDFKCSAQLNCESGPLFCFQCLHLKVEKVLQCQHHGSQSNPSITSCY